MARLRYNLLQNTLATDLLAAGPDTSIDFGTALQEGGVNILTVVAPDVLALRVDSEIMYLTAYTSGATSGTVLRAQEDTVIADHTAGSIVRNVITKEDVGGGVPYVLVAGADAPNDVIVLADYVCDGTNDEVQVNAALTALAAITTDGGVLELAGTISCSAAILFPVMFNVNVRGYGRSRGYGPNAYVERVGGTDPLFDLSTNGASAYFTDLAINDPDAAARTDPLIDALNAGDTVVLDRCYVTNSQASSVCITTGLSELHVFDCELTSTTDVISSPDGGASIIVSRCRWTSTDGHLVDYDDTGGSFSPQVQIAIQDCRTGSGSSSGSDGIIKAIGTSSGPLSVRVEGCKIRTPLAVAIELTGCEVKIANNVIGRVAPTITDLGQTSIKCTSCTGVVNDNQVLHAGHHGIWLVDSSDMFVEGNKIDGVGRVTTATYSGILIDGNSDRNSIVNNSLRRAASGNQPLYGIRIDDSTCNDNYVHANDILQASATNGNEVSDIGTGTRGQEVLAYALSDETTAIAATGQKLSVRIPFAFVLTRCRASLNTASASAGPFTIDVEEGGVSVFTTDLLEIDDTELTSVTAVTQPNITDHYLAEDAIITFDVDDVGDGTATGAKVALYGWRI